MASEQDRLAKALYHRLIQAGFSHRGLIECGWFVFVEGKPANTDTALGLAGEATHHLCSAGKLPHMRMQCVRAMVSFLKAELGYVPTVDELKRLKAIMDQTPVSNHIVVNWFHEVYGN